MDSVTYGATGFGAGQAAVRAETARGALNRDTVPDTALRPQIAPFIEEMEVETQITLRYEYGDTDSEDEAARPPPALDPASRPSARPPLKRSAFEIVSDEEESEEEEIPRSSLPNKKPKQTEVVDLTGPLPHVFAAANRTATHRVSYEISSDEEDSVTIKKEPTSKKRVCYEIDSDDEDAIAAVKVENMSTKREKTNSANRTVYNKLYKSYKPFSREGDSHPSGLVESASLGAVSLPSNVKGQELGFDTKTCLYREQADALRAILASTKTFLPNGSNGQEPAARAGFLLGDGTGVGKGRVAAAFIRHLWEEEGVRRFVWLSPINALFEDAKRDLTDVGLFGLLGFRFAHLKDSDCKAKFGARKPDGVLFATYPLFVHDARYKQLLGYLSKGEEYVRMIKSCWQRILTNRFLQWPVCNHLRRITSRKSRRQNGNGQEDDQASVRDSRSARPVHVGNSSDGVQAAGIFATSWSLGNGDAF